MTWYTSSDSRWCGFDRTHPVLPEFVRRGMTVAIAEPYSGSSYSGDPGEACGECWELDTTFGTEIVMVHDLCPIEGNPICVGSHFHFDVSSEVAGAVDGGGWLGEGAVRRVPCPVTGNIHVHVTARNQWGYMQIGFFNHTHPLRQVEYRAPGGEWLPMERCLARWCLDGDMETFSDDGPGGMFRLTSATGEVVEGSEVLTYSVSEGDDFDTGIQFTPVDPTVDSCTFTPPGDVYTDGWGGIPGVRWDSNSWGSTELSETTDGCVHGSCILLRDFEGSGVHLTYRHVFPVTTFSTLSLMVRTQSASGTIDIAPRTEEARCSVTTTADVTADWSPVEIDIAASCPEASEIHGLTISHPSVSLDLLLDDVLFE
jgi:hypothetical protein